VVEGGTLLRCYTSQRGIEGSNPSSSAPKATRLQEQSEGEEVGRVRSLGVGNLGMLPATFVHRTLRARLEIGRGREGCTIGT
jgi:hypothetical protein